MFLAALAVPVFMASCGGNKTENASSDTMSMDTALPPATTEVAAEDTTVSNTIQLTGNDQMKFNRTVLRVKAGEKVTLTLKNVGSMPKESMAHNFIVLKPGTDMEQFSMKAMVAKETDYIPDAMKSVILAHSKLVGPGESTTLEFTVPKGEYDFLCSFPGHWATMKGKLIAM